MEQEEVKGCPLCASRSVNEYLRVKDNRYRKDYASWLRKCDQCELIFLSPRPLKKEISKFYPREYFSSQEISPVKDYIANWEIFRFIKKIHPQTGKVLDLGCGRGNLLVGLKNQGWQSCGAEISQESVQFAKKRGIEDIFVGDIESMEFNRESFDLIILHHVLEHLYDPKAMLEKGRRWLKKDGILLITVPNFDSYLIKIFKEKALIEIPRHLFQFTPKTIDKLLTVSGFKVTKKVRFNFIQSAIVFRATIALLRGEKINPKISLVDILSFFWACLVTLLGKNETITIAANKYADI